MPLISIHAWFSPAFTHSVAESSTASFIFATLVCDSRLTHRLKSASIFHCTSGHHSHKAGDRTWCRPIPGREYFYSEWIPALGCHAPTASQAWAGLRRGSGQGHVKGWPQHPLPSPGALLCLRSPERASFLPPLGCLGYTPSGFYVFFEKITQNQCGRQAGKTSVAK